MRLLLAALLTTIFPLAAQQITGFTPGSAVRQAALESRLLAIPDTAMAQRHARILAARPHVAGTPAQVATADYVLRQMASWGLDTARVRYRVYLPYHDSTIVDVILPAGRERLALDEPVLADDPTTGEEPWPAMNGYSGAGDVTAPVIYLNYGLPSDYAALDSLGLSAAGKIVLARYGRSFRGIKAREAAANGAVGLMLYSDPMDDGFLVGEVYPDGPMRSPGGVQRGSLFLEQGDPSTPGWPSRDDARRIPASEMAVPSIPVVPIGYGNAKKFLGVLGGPSVPNNWQGGLGFRYHIGGGAEVRARVAVWPERGERAYKTIENTFGVIRGSEQPAEQVIIGAHRDAWTPGALDNVSGTISVLESARTWGELARAGLPPMRTLVFATWDAEEWGLIGSTEWVEENAEMLRESTVAYLNQDGIAGGRMFGAGGTASLGGLLHEVSQLVTQPGDSVSVYRDWERRTVTSTRPTPPVGDLGGGSDFMGFYNHIGIPAINFGFGGPGGSYHSNYDTWSFVERFADPGYFAHRAAAQVASLLLARFANAEVVPFEYGTLGAYLGTLVERTRGEAGAEAIGASLDEVGAAADLLARVGRRFALARNEALSARHPAAMFTESNRLLRGVERQLTDSAGLNGRPFLRNLVFASDRDDGYANVQFPSVVEALRDGDPEGARAASGVLAERIRLAASLVARATEALP
jgi:N-acetylated-alpha-linked acidic dipeptidase